MASDIPINEFLGEAEDIIDSLNSDLITIASSLTGGQKVDPSLLNNIFRAAHSLKGISGLFGFADLTNLAHTLENMLDRLRMGKIELCEEVLDLLFESMDMLRAVVASKAENAEPPPLKEVENLTDRLENAEFGKKQDQPEDALSCVGLEILSVLTEYEEHRLGENIREGMNIIKLRAAFDLATFDEDLTELQAVAKQNGEIITTLPSAEDSSDDKITFDVVVGTDQPLASIQEALAGRGIDISVLRQGTSAAAAPAAQPAAPKARAEKKHAPKKPAAAPAPEDEAEEPAEQEMPASLRTISQTVRVDISKLDNLMNIVGELVISKNNLAQLVERLRNIIGFNEVVMELIKNSRTMERKLSELQQGVLEVRMVPVGQIFDKLHRNVRKLARELDKDVEFQAEGGDTELDKLIIEDLADPLMHIIRNSMDHGIESKAERIQLGKPEKGMIRLRAFQRGNHVVIEIYDDGAGINLEKVRQAAIARGLIDPQADLRREELTEFLFSAGFSTADHVSEISGRGVGLDVVKANISALSGAINVESTPGEGSKFTITLPITLAIIQALIVEASRETFAIPLNSVQQGLMISPDDIQTIEGREVIELRGKTLPLIRLDKMFGLKREAAGPRDNGDGDEPPPVREAPGLIEDARADQGPGFEDDSIYVVKVGIADRGLGIIVDKLWGRQDIVIKSVGEILKGIRGIAGATELGNQRTILVLDVMDLMEEAAVSSAALGK